MNPSAPPTIEITITPDGQTRVETYGFAGADCQAATRGLLAALGAAQREQLKSEYYVTRAASASLSQPP